ncbi:Protein CsiD [Salmonella bongori]|nr:Protein CsiD [Salmonella bongori]
MSIFLIYGYEMSIAMSPCPFTEKETILMNALTAVKANADDVVQRYPGFTFVPSAQSPRLLALTFTADTTTQFLQQVAQWPVQALEYKSFLRFKIGKILDDLCGNQLQPLLIKTLLNRAEGALLINAEGIDDVAQADEMVKLATAVAHLIAAPTTMQ